MATHTPEAPTTSPLNQPERESWFQKNKRKVAAAIAVVAVGGVGGVVAVAQGGNSPEGARQTQGATGEPGKETAPVDAPQEFLAPEKVAYPKGALENATEQEWGNIFNETILTQLSWYFNELVDNPDKMDQIPVDSFTDNPNSEFVTTLKAMAAEVVAANPNAADIQASVCPTATAGTSPDIYGCAGFSSFMSVPEEYPEMSGLNIEYIVQDKDGTFSPEHQELLATLYSNYKMTQAEDGTLRIN